MFFIHEKEANSIFTKSGLKHLVAVTPSIIGGALHYFHIMSFPLNVNNFQYASA